MALQKILGLIAVKKSGEGFPLPLMFSVISPDDVLRLIRPGSDYLLLISYSGV
ncbi:hypothetical protein LTSEURB_1067 [Salmonella enterica subsp. enterica serovar Urbana str. R8-2977]|uniref:Uncharacterized protein n=1 Tax=Salmonella enterica subsp. enterica serovar Urbana str. R8-2977 TaxID=913084 RepID=G5RS99_SALET|nr:hypothetical protein LTSEJOH_1120 [Salmonella enterica subsp. enterica serovar Johannesburg str. S5-703]EHD05938.1 hypothetical protein LTSEURB_1067 [Salmonella enterica subsp. enterica serovar Urbana str. R8-2977]